MDDSAKCCTLINSAEGLEKTLHRFVWLYNHHLPQKALGHEAPVQALKN